MAFRSLIITSHLFASSFRFFEKITVSEIKSVRIEFFGKIGSPHVREHMGALLITNCTKPMINGELQRAVFLRGVN